MMDIPQERIIEDVGTLKALADPVRMTLLDLTMAQPERTWTARELAGIIGVLPTNVYYHLNLLERNELLQVRDTRIVNGIIEKHYGAGQRQLSFHRRFGEDSDGPRDLAATMIDQVREDIDRGLVKGVMKMNRDASDSERVVISRALVQIPEDRIAQFREELVSLVHRYEASGEAGQRFVVLAAMHPSDI